MCFNCGIFGQKLGKRMTLYTDSVHLVEFSNNVIPHNN